MKEKKIISNGFTWLPLEKRGGKFSSPTPPRRAETRKPLLWLAPYGDELYFVNSSDETMDFVQAGGGGYVTGDDDDVISVSNENAYEYENVLAGDAVKVEEYDGFYDLDYILQVVIALKSKKLGHCKVFTPPKKGGVGETIILWDTGEWACPVKQLQK